MNAGAKRAQNVRASRVTKSRSQETEPIPSPTETKAKTGQVFFSESISIRQNRVIELQKLIQQGKFCPTNDKIAQAMLGELISIPTD
jgi:anti-sigma28 factor (negative regulator of flagellin synthesis)